jgi:hypothetical protein
VHPASSPPPARDILVQGYCAGAVTTVVATNSFRVRPERMDHRSGRRRGAAVPGHAFRIGCMKAFSHSRLKRWGVRGRARSPSSPAHKPKVKDCSARRGTTLAVKASRPLSGADWVHEIKHARISADRPPDGRTVRLYSRSAGNWTARVSAICRCCGAYQGQELHD